MPPPIPVELRSHDPAFAARARRRGAVLAAALGDRLLAVHHIGSTAVPGIAAKPVLDLFLVVRDLAGLDRRQVALEALGYAAWGELGLPGRRYFTLADTGGRRLEQLHAYARGSPEIDRHLAFRDHLRAHPGLARAYEREKRRCRRIHPQDSHAYGDCKAAWIARIEAAALASRRT
ncbi:GrpB family protein [Acuticoccus mangrovi]|uniref:GrpB family protein n=1 Tax=Acuticoccus mangrovi TaxID=2796142 RepID=A0A934MCG8_9HYPH|nr:GrpB family protein [Acuticoccus mangrovi]MBJ3775257.1 GrpB family protein [Acuticoccus mangrovi]